MNLPDLTRPGSFPADTVWPEAVDPARLTALRAKWLRHLGLPPDPDANSVLQTHLPPQVVEKVKTPTHERRRLLYQVEDGLMAEAWLLIPNGLTGRAPGIVVFHPTTWDTIHEPAGLAGPASRHTGLQLVEAGYVVLCPENFLWNYRGRRTPETGDFKVALGELMERFHADHPGWTGMAKMVWDAKRAVDLLSTLPYVDRRRLGCFGMSLGGKEALYLPAFDRRIVASVSVDGGIGLPYSNWEDPWYLGERAKSLDGDHHEVLALAAPCAFLLIGSAGGIDEETGQQVAGYDGERSWPYLQAALPAWESRGETGRLGMLNHEHGHSIPAIARAATMAWFEKWL